MTFEPHDQTPLLFPCSGDSFMIGTISTKNEAHLLVYKLKLSVTSHEYEAKLDKTLKKFTSKPITQVSYIIICR